MAIIVWLYICTLTSLAFRSQRLKYHTVTVALRQKVRKHFRYCCGVGPDMFLGEFVSVAVCLHALRKDSLGQFERYLCRCFVRGGAKKL